MTAIPAGTADVGRAEASARVGRPRLGRPRKLSPLAWREARWALILIAPWIIGFLAFTAIPMIATLIFTFTNINLKQASPPRFLGLANYQALLARPQGRDPPGVRLDFAPHAPHL